MAISADAVYRNCYPTTCSKAESLALQSSKFLNPIVEHIAVGRRHHVILSSRVAGSTPGTVYYTEAEIEEESGRVVGYGCDCPASKKYSGMCKHAAALILRYVDEPGSFQVFGAKPKRQTTPGLIDLMGRRATQPAGRPSPSVDLDMVLTHQTNDSWTLALKVVGPTGASYVVKSIEDFVHRMRIGEQFSYGKKLAFTHTPDILLPRARKIEQFLEGALIRRNEIFYSGIGYYGTHPKVQREMQLAKSELLSLLEALEGETVTIVQMVRMAKDDAYAYRYGSYCTESAPVTALIQQGAPKADVTFTEASDGYGLALKDDQRGVPISDGQRIAIWQGSTIWLCPASYMRIAGFLGLLFRESSLFIAKKDEQRFSSTVLDDVEEILGIKAPPSLDALKPVPCRLQFYFDRRGGQILCTAKAVYGSREYPIGSPYTSEDSLIRDSDAESQALVLLERYLSYLPQARSGAGLRFCLDEDDERHVVDLFEQGLPAFGEVGEVFSTDSFNRLFHEEKPQIHTGLSLASNLINLTISSDDLDAEEVSQLLGSYRERRRYHRLKDGSYLSMAGIDLSELDRMSEDLGLTPRQIAKGSVSLPVYEAFYLEDRLKDAERDQSYLACIDRFEKERTKERKPPEAFGHILRGYQKEGFSWLSLLASCGFGGILADEMGLGKSVQLISWIASEHSSARTAGPHLIVCPASLVFNWKAEFERFAPDLEVVAVTGTKSQRQALRLQAMDEADAIVTSYDILRIDIEDFAELHFASCTLDEAQYIKNRNTKVAKAAKLIQADHRFALTGTPVENRPSELWSIFDFLMPGLLGSAKHFRDRFEAPIIAGDEEAAASLQALTGPFIMRRLKADVLKDLPEKMESSVFAQLEGSQLKLYRAQEQHLRDSLVSSKKKGSASGAEDMNKIQVLAEITRLRQICLDPSLVFENYRGGAAKLDTIMDLVEQGIESGQKMLIFSQFTSFLVHIEKRLDKAGISFYEITGSTPKKKRLELVDAFNCDEVPVFLISLKAGGTGLNLTGASIVIHADPWWNAAAEHQATDRAHRIGQQHTVSVYKVIAKGTIEERIVDLQKRKNALAQSLMAGTETSLASLSSDDLIALLS